jgi:pyruvate dehydrogenase E2 component (dihydrolipoamide acetyltransferase)
LFSYETDKSTFEEEAKADGTLLAVFYHEDDDVPVLLNVAVIGKPGESFTEFAPDGAASADEKPAEAPAAEEPSAAPALKATAERAEGVSPRAKAAAKSLDVDPALAVPTGPHGRVIERDIVSLAAQSRTGSSADARPRRTKRPRRKRPQPHRRLPRRPHPTTTKSKCRTCAA